MTRKILMINRTTIDAMVDRNRQSLNDYERIHAGLINETLRKGQAFYIFVIRGAAFGAICPGRVDPLGVEYGSVMRQQMENIRETRDPVALMSAHY